MADTTLKSVFDLVELAGKLTGKTLLIPGGDRIEDIKLVGQARDAGLIQRAILIGNKEKILTHAKTLNTTVNTQDIIDADNEDAIGQQTVEAINAGRADIVLKGGISTPVINRYMLKVAVKRTVSLASVFNADAIAGGRPMVLTDAGVTTLCTFGRMIDLIGNAVETARVVMGLDRPRVAVLSANEKQIPSLPSTSLGLELSRLDWANAVVCGPLSFDLATDPESVAIKGLPQLPNADHVAGKADVLVCPGIDAANVLYKVISAMVKHGAASIASITLGFKVPYIILSRSDNLQTRLESVALCSVYAHRMGKQQHARPGQAPVQLARPKTVLVVNPGSTSLKMAIFENHACKFEQERAFRTTPAGSAKHRIEGGTLIAECAKQWLAEIGIDSLDVVVGRGGFLPRSEDPPAGGVYRVAERGHNGVVVDAAIMTAMTEHPSLDHPSNLGILAAGQLAAYFQVPAYSVDPVVVDEFSPLARFSGYSPITRRSAAHVLSVREAARKAARTAGRRFEDCSFVVAHLGGGITVAAVEKGRIVDNNIALLGGGPFTPKRAGQLPMNDLIELCYSGRFTKQQLKTELASRGGLFSYLQESRMDVIERRIEDGDEQARLVVEAMVYQISKEIGAAFAALQCSAEAIVLVGGLVRSKYVNHAIRKRIGRLAPVMVFEESLEMAALAGGAIAAMTGEEKAIHYRLPDWFEALEVEFDNK